MKFPIRGLVGYRCAGLHRAGLGLIHKVSGDAQKSLEYLKGVFGEGVKGKKERGINCNVAK